MCRIAGSPIGTHGAHWAQALAARVPPSNLDAPGLDVSSFNVLKNLLVQDHLREEPLQLRVFLLKLLHTLGLTHLQPAILLATAVIGLLRLPVSRRATEGVFPFAIITSSCRSRFMTCFGLYFLALPIPCSRQTSSSKLTGTDFVGQTRLISTSF